MMHESDSFAAPREYSQCQFPRTINGKVYCKPNFVPNPPSYCDAAKTLSTNPPGCPCGSVAPVDGYYEANKLFFGRGAIQLSWNYNYNRASAALTRDPNTFCN